MSRPPAPAQDRGCTGQLLLGADQAPGPPTDPCLALPPQPRPAASPAGRLSPMSGQPGPKARPVMGGGRELPAQQSASGYFPWKKCLQTPRGREAPAHESRLCCTAAEPRPRQGPRPRPHPVLSQALSPSSHSAGPSRLSPTPGHSGPWPSGPPSPSAPCKSPAPQDAHLLPTKWAPRSGAARGQPWRLAPGPGPLPLGLAPLAASKCRLIGICLPPGGVSPALPSPGFSAMLSFKTHLGSNSGDDS